MKKLAVYMKPYWKTAVLAPVMMLLEVVMDLLQPTLMASIIDRGIANGDMDYIIRTGLLMVGVAAIGMLGGAGCTLCSSIASQSFGTDLRLEMFRRIQTFSFDNLDKFNTASLITRLTSDVMQVQTVALAMMRMLVRAPLLSIGGIIMALAINPGLALILLFTVPLLVVTLAVVIKKGFPLFSAVQKKLDRLNAVMRENLTGVRVVKAFVRSGFEQERFGAANSDLRSITVRASRMVGMTMPVMMLIMNLSMVAVVWFGGLRVHAGGMQIGQVMAFINYMVQILFSLMMLAFMLIMVSRAKASVERINEVLDTDVRIKDSVNADAEPIQAGQVDFDNVSFRYEGAGGAPVLKNITFSASAGETVAILGSTGSGKSTLVNLLPRFYEPSEGHIRVDGRDLKDIKLSALRQSISLVLQESILFTGTIRENIRWGDSQASEEAIVEAAKAAQAHDFIVSFPDGYETLLGQRGVNLSGGQKQRLSIARALLKKPRILVLDDSTSAVDMVTEARIQAALKERLAGTTVFVVAQRISSVLEADKILVLEDGEIMDMGTHHELLLRCPVYQDIYHSQIGEEVV